MTHCVVKQVMSITSVSDCHEIALYANTQDPTLALRLLEITLRTTCANFSIFRPSSSCVVKSILHEYIELPCNRTGPLRSKKMPVTIYLPLGVVAAVITASEYVLSTIATLSARATLHGLWLLGLHRGGEAALNARERRRKALRKDFVSFMLTVSLVIAAAGVETSLEPMWKLQPYALNTTRCVSVFGKYDPNRLNLQSPPFRVTVEPWVFKTAEQLKCTNGIASVGVGSWTHVSGHKMDMSGPICINNSLDLSTGLVGVSLKTYKFGAFNFSPRIGLSPAYTLFPLNGNRIGTGLHNISAALEGKGSCGKRGISAYYMNMNADYQTMKIHGWNMSLGIHERLCTQHGSRPVKSLTGELVKQCTLRRQSTIDVECLRNSTSSKGKYSAILSDIASLYVSDKANGASYACIQSTVQVEYVFLAPESVTQFMHTMAPQGGPKLPVLIPTAVKAISGTCERTIAPIARSALLFSTEQEWRNLELAEVDRQIRFHAFMMAVSDSLFPMSGLKEPESSSNDGACYTRPCFEVTQIPWSWALIFFIVSMSLVVIVTLSAFFFRFFFRGESWMVGSARWSLARLLGDTGGEGQPDQEALIEAIPIDSEPGFINSFERRSTSFNWGRNSITAEGRDWKYEFRVRKRNPPEEATEVESAKPLGRPSSHDRDEGLE